MEKGDKPVNKTKQFFLHHWPIILIMVLAVFLRLFRINDLTAFLGEQGRDLIIARNILLGKFTLLGPSTSISQVHFGPFYHYFNAFFLFIFGLDPIGPAIGFSLLSLFSVYFIYSIATTLGHKKVGIISSLLFAVSPWMVEYGRSTFNSFFITAFSTFSLWGLIKYLKDNNKSNRVLYLLLSGIFAGLAVQANFLAAGVPLGLLLFLLLKKVSFKKQLYAYLGIFLAIFPYLAFEFRHQFFNFRAFLSLSGEGKAVSFSFYIFLKRIILNFLQATRYSLFYHYPNWLSVFLFILIFLGIVTLFVKNPKSDLLRSNLVFLLLGLIVVSIYPGQMLVHYLGAIYPNIFLLTGMLLGKISSGKFKYLGLALTFGLTILNLSKINFSQQNMPEGWDLDGVRKASFIISGDAGDNFNIANLLDGDTRAYSYRYFVQLAGKIPREVEEYPQAGILYVITRKSEDVINYPVWEIDSFLPARVTKEWPVKNGISVFKLEKI